jgi:TM2 domain-containing membrane protein YozV
MRLEEAMVWLIWMPAILFIGYLFLTLEAAYGERVGDGMVGGTGAGAPSTQVQNRYAFSGEIGCPAWFAAT